MMVHLDPKWIDFTGQGHRSNFKVTRLGESESETGKRSSILVVEKQILIGNCCSFLAFCYL